METMSGVVEAVRKDRKGFMINENWYSSYNPLESDVQKGSSVVFNYVEKGRYKNIKGPVRVDGTAPVPTSAPKGGGKAWDNTGVEVGHASNLAMRIMEQRIATGSFDGDVGDDKYWALFAKDTIDTYKLMAGIKEKVRSGLKSDSSDKPAKTEEPANDEVDDLF